MFLQCKQYIARLHLILRLICHNGVLIRFQVTRIWMTYEGDFSFLVVLDTYYNMYPSFISVRPSFKWERTFTFLSSRDFSFKLLLVFFILLTPFTPRSHKFSPIPTCTNIILFVRNNNKSNSLLNFSGPMYHILPSRKNLKHHMNHINSEHINQKKNKFSSNFNLPCLVS
jgi:hypothetical protein